MPPPSLIPSRAERRALSDALRGAVRGPGPALTDLALIGALHWLAHTEALRLRADAEIVRWTAALPGCPADLREELSRDLRTLRGLNRQLGALSAHQAAALLRRSASTSVWHEWLHLILTPPGAPASAGRAAQLAALERAYRRGEGGDSS